MLHRVRSAARDRVVRAVQEALGGELAGARAELAAVRAEVAAVHDRLGRLEERVDGVGGGLHDHLTAWERRNRRDVLTAADWDATITSAEFFRRELATATAHFDKHDTLRAALRESTTDGLFLEFGVASGRTLRIITEHAPAGTVHGFDCFEGLPEHWRSGFGVGAFAADVLPDVPGAELVVGLFDQTLPGFLAEHDEPVAFLHLDADLYSSTRTVLTALAPRMRAGTVLVFDEYFNFPGWAEHEHRAWTEFVRTTGLEFEYLGFTADDEQLSLRLLSAPVVPGEVAAMGPFGTSRLPESTRV
jgi:hypothetical protein